VSRKKGSECLGDQVFLAGSEVGCDDAVGPDEQEAGSSALRDECVYVGQLRMVGWTGDSVGCEKLHEPGGEMGE
jgi:hypothetical protein